MTRESSQGQGLGLPDQSIVEARESFGRNYGVFYGGPEIAGYATGETHDVPQSFLDLLPTIPTIQNAADVKFSKSSYPLPLVLYRAASAARAYTLPRDDHEKQDVPRAVARIGQERDHFSAALDAFSKGIHPPSFREQGYTHIYTAAEGTCYIALDRSSQMMVVSPTDVMNFSHGTNQSMVEQTGHEASVFIRGGLRAQIPISELGISSELYDASFHLGKQVITTENTLLSDILEQQGVIDRYRRWYGSPARTRRAYDPAQPVDYRQMLASSVDCFGESEEKEIRDGLFEQYRAVAYVPGSPLIAAINAHVKGLDEMYATGLQHVGLPPQPLSEPQYTLHLLKPSQGL